jgi:ABC-2 type transport system ATP-binding protein
VPGTPVLRVHDLTFQYSRGRSVLDGVALEILPGEIYGLLGPNGAGKSSLMKLLLGLNLPSSGSIEWFGSRISKKTKQRIGYVPQDLALLYDLKAVDNVRFFGRLYGLSGARLAERVEKALKFVGLWDDRTKSPNTYSGGMKRRLNIACGIVHDPDVVIMDEPTVGVDPQSRNRILEAIEELRDGGATIIYISHYMEEVERLCTRIGVMDSGRFLCDGTKDELLAEYAPEAIVTLDVAAGRTIPDTALAGFTVVSRTDDTVSVSVPGGHLDVLADLSAGLGDTVQGFTYVPPNLEQVFFRLTMKTLRD